MAAPTLAEIVTRYGIGQAISLQQVTQDFGVDDLTIYDAMAASRCQFSPDWTPRMVNDDVWTIAPTREIMAEALATAANGSWSTWQMLEQTPMKRLCQTYLGIAIVMAAQPDGFRSPDGTVYRASVEAPNRVKVWKE